MIHYVAIGVESGRRIVLHGARALRAYLRDAEAGLAEPIRTIRAGLDRRVHRSAYEHGLCYGPCTLESGPRGG